MANSAGDWGKSNPLAVPEFILEMRRRGHAEDVIRKVVHDNPLAFFRQCARLSEEELTTEAQRTQRRQEEEKREKAVNR
jgi:hypothetical protein